MKTGNVLVRFKIRLLLEDFLKSLLLGLLGAGALVFTVSFYYHVKLSEDSMDVMMKAGGAAFAIVFIVCFFIVFYPRKKRVAERVDALGLKERVVTLLEFKDNDSEMARLQREDALKAIKAVKTSKLKLTVKKWELIAPAAAIALALVMTALPADIFDFRTEEEIAEDERLAYIEAALEEMREAIKDEKLTEEQRAELEEMLAELEEKLMNENLSELEQDLLMQEMQEAIDEMLEAAEGEPEEGEAGEGEEPAEGEEPEDGAPPDGEEPPEGGEPPEDGEMPEGAEPPEGDGEDTVRTEGIYDPVSGYVPYGDVFALYFSDYIKSLEDSDLSEDEQNMLDEYFSALSQ